MESPKEPEDPQEPLKFKPIEDEQKYYINRARIEKGALYLKDKWESEDPKDKELIVRWEKLALAVLLYEIDNNLLPI